MAARRTQQPRPLLRQPRPTRSSTHSRTHAPTCTTAVPVRTTWRGATSKARIGSPPRSWPSSTRRATPRHTSAARRRSWRRSAPAWPRWASTSHAFTPSRSDLHRNRHPASRQAAARTPHPPAGEQGTGPTIEFARSDLAVRWSDDYPSLLELAEACDVPVRWSCRTGVCHSCETTLIAGTVGYDPDPVEPPTDGSALICCSTPHDDLVLDL